MISIYKRGALLLSLFLVSFISAQTSTEILRVEGNCSMCKSNIEQAAKTNPYVETAVWNQKTKELTVAYNTDKTSNKAILKQIATAGYDNQSYRASQKTYNSLEACCQYRRPDNSTKIDKDCTPNHVCEIN